VPNKFFFIFSRWFGPIEESILCSFTPHASLSFSIGRRLFRCCTYLIKLVRRLFREAIKTARSLYIPSPQILRRGQKAVLNAAVLHYIHLGKPFVGRRRRSFLWPPWLESHPNAVATWYLFSVEKYLTVVFIRTTKLRRI